MLTASFATQISNANMRFASDGGTVVILALLPIANDRMRGAASEKEYDDALREGVRRRTAKTLRPTHMRPPMAVPASVDNKESSWPDLRNLDRAEAP